MSRTHTHTHTHSCVWHDSFICVTWLIRMCDMTHVWHDSFISVTWLIHMCDMTHLYDLTQIIRVNESCHTYKWVMSLEWGGSHAESCICLYLIIHMCTQSFICVTWRIHKCDMMHSHVWHDLCTCVTCLIHMCDMTDPHVWHDLFICVTWLKDMWEMTHHLWFKRRWFPPNT